MKIAHSFRASIALLIAPVVLAESTKTSAVSSTDTSSAPKCTASLKTKLCDYTKPERDDSVVFDNKDSCLDYCNDHQPCNFVIFNAGASTGSSSCWLYPGAAYNTSAAKTSCSGSSNYNLTVYDKPVCSSTPTNSGCIATATPSALASVCGYPAPNDCVNDCLASSGAEACLKSCAEADACSYAVFNPRNPSNSPYASGTCWIYPNGTYDAGQATSCSGDPEQFVYANACPKPSPSSPLLSSSTTATTNASGTTSGTGGAKATQNSATDKENSAPAALPLTSPVAIGLAMLLWQILT